MNHTNSDTLSWDDLRIILAIGRAGSVRGAGKRLLLSHATVSRHLAQLRERLGVRFFERDGRRLRPTSAGSQLIDAAERIEAEVDQVQRNIAGGDFQLRGTVRVAMAPSLLHALSEAIANLGDLYPDIRLEFTTGLALSNLTRREADVVVRVADSPSDTLVGKKIGRFDVAAYACKDLARDIDGAPIRKMPWVGWDERVGLAAGHWVRKEIPRAQVRATSDTETTVFELIRAGVGVGFLPCILASADPNLVRIEPTPPVFSTAIWVLTHHDLRYTGRIRAVMSSLGEAIRDQKSLFEAKD